MLRHHFALALRVLRRQKGYAAINVLGLAVGIACCLLIGRFVAEELSYDRFHADADTIYRVNWALDRDGISGTGPGTPPPLAARFADEIPGVEAATRLYPVAKTTVRHGDTFFADDAIVAADPDVFSFFSFDLLEGDPATALAAPNQVVLSESVARRYFGDAPALGQTLTIGEEKEMFRAVYAPTFRVTGIVADLPSTSHIRFDMLTSMASHPEVAFFDWSWVWMQVATYVKVPEVEAVAGVEAKAKDIVATYAPAAFERVGFSYAELIAAGGRWDFVLQPFTDVYLGSAAIGNRVGPVGNRSTVWLFATIAAFVLLIACVNFMNLATARAARRAREVGVRKALGSTRRTLVAQFVTEAIVFCALALPAALLLAGLAIEPFNRLSGKALELNMLEPAWLPFALVLGTAFVGLVAGSYPGLYLSSFRPIQTLRGTFTPKGRGQRFRHGLVVFQFALSIGLIACTLVVLKQMDYVQTTDLGFEQAGVLVLSNESDRLGGQAEALKARLERHAAVQGVTISTGVPPSYGFEDYYKVEGRGDEQLSLLSYQTDEDFLPTLGMEIAEGRGFTGDPAIDARAVIVNEAAAEAFGWNDPIGETIEYPSQGTYEVIGVMEDAHFLSLHTPILPFALFHRASDSYRISESYVVARVAPDELERGLALVRAEWEAVAPDAPFAYSLLDERLGESYRAEQRLAEMFSVFSGLAIFIACLGLLGLAAYAAEQRTKEIGIRKVLGASEAEVVGLLSRDFIGLVLVGFVVATPVAYFGLEAWLDGFTYRTQIEPGVFVIAGLAGLAVALLTVSIHAVRAAIADPVDALRHD